MASASSAFSLNANGTPLLIVPGAKRTKRERRPRPPATASTAASASSSTGPVLAAASPLKKMRSDEKEATKTTQPWTTRPESDPQTSPVAAGEVAALPPRASAVRLLANAAAAKDREEPCFGNYEYLDHTADIQFHAWGATLGEALEEVILCMMGYMTELDKVSITSKCTIRARGHDLKSLLFSLMDEFLFCFSDTDRELVCRDVRITHFDRENYRITAVGYGERFDLAKHPQGTEIKAITYSNMQLYDDDAAVEAAPALHARKGKADIYVIVDI